MPEEKEVDPGQALKARSLKEFSENTVGKPTPTQEENDRAAMGEHVIEKEADGSAEQPENSGPGAAPKRKTSEAQHSTAGGYQTRQATPARPAPSRTE
jgi:hypothetical protein